MIKRHIGVKASKFIICLAQINISKSYLNKIVVHCTESFYLVAFVQICVQFIVYQIINCLINDISKMLYQACI